MWSKSSVESDWLAPELSLILEPRRVISVVLDDGLNVPEPFDRLQQHNLSDWPGDISAPEFEKFVSAFTIVLESSEEASIIGRDFRVLPVGAYLSVS